jgi:hypothetical protein
MDKRQIFEISISVEVVFIDDDINSEAVGLKIMRNKDMLKLIDSKLENKIDSIEEAVKEVYSNFTK